MRNGPGGTLVPDLAERWSVDASGKTWTVDLRADARWHDGTPVTPDDVIFTIETLQDPAYTGPSATSWSEVTVATTGPRQVRFTLKTPLGGFLQALTQPIAPAHLLGEVPIDPSPTTRSAGGRSARVRSLLTDLTPTSASLVPAEVVLEDGEPEPDGRLVARFAHDARADPPPLAAVAVPRGHRVPLLHRCRRTSSAISAPAISTARRASRRQMRSSSGRWTGARLVRYPGSTLTAVLLNLRPGHPEFSPAAVRTSLLAASNRERLIQESFAGMAAPATGPIPPVSPMFDPAADPAVAYSRGAAEAAFKAATWTKDAKGWRLPERQAAAVARGPEPDQGIEPGSLRGSRGSRPRLDRGRPRRQSTSRCHRPSSSTDRLSTGTFQVAVADLRIGLDPDLYPLLASSQTLTGGSNVIGVQSAELDTLLEKARAPGSASARTGRLQRAAEALAAGRYLLPLAFADEVVVLRDTVEGPAIRQVTDGSDRFWDVLTWRLAVGR